MGNIYYYDYTNMSSNSTDNYMTPAEGEYYDYANMTSEEEEATAAATAVKIISITIYRLCHRQPCFRRGACHQSQAKG